RLMCSSGQGCRSATYGIGRRRIKRRSARTASLRSWPRRWTGTPSSVFRIPIETFTSPHGLRGYEDDLFPVAKTEVGVIACLTCYDTLDAYSYSRRPGLVGGRHEPDSPVTQAELRCQIDEARARWLSGGAS
ncbi:MAG: hypothetical protein ACE5EV_08030, partial [Gaiellales bacterium]